MGNKINDTELTASLAKNTLDEIPQPKCKRNRGADPAQWKN